MDKLSINFLIRSLEFELQEMCDKGEINTFAYEKVSEKLKKLWKEINKEEK